MEGADLIDKALHLGMGIVVGDTHLPEHHRAQIPVTYQHRHSHIHDTTVAQVDIGSLQPHRLQTRQGVASVAALAENGIFPDDAAEFRTAGVLGDGISLEVDGDDRSACQTGKLILHRFPQGNIQQHAQIKIPSCHGRSPLSIIYRKLLEQQFGEIHRNESFGDYSTVMFRSRKYWRCSLVRPPSLTTASTSESSAKQWVLLRPNLPESISITT